MIIQGVGILLGTITAGTTAAGAGAINAARIAAAAPRLFKIIETLRTLAATAAAPLRLAATSLNDVRRELAVFRRVRVTLASTHSAERLARVARAARDRPATPGSSTPMTCAGCRKADVESHAATVGRCATVRRATGSC